MFVRISRRSERHVLYRHPECTPEFMAVMEPLSIDLKMYILDSKAQATGELPKYKATELSIYCIKIIVCSLITEHGNTCKKCMSLITI